MNTLLSDSVPPRRRGLPAVRWGFHARGLIGGCVLFPVAGIVMFAEPVIPRNSWGDVVLHSLGWVVFALGILFRFWATLYVGGRKRVALMREGPYSVCRNPLYLGTFFVLLATGLFLQSLSFVAFIGVVAIAYVALTVPAEEDDLRAIHGEAYQEYCRSVPRFWPNFRLFHSPQVVDVTTKGLRLEMKRAAIWLLLPVAGELFAYVRYLPDWPHFFRIL